MALNIYKYSAGSEAGSYWTNDSYAWDDNNTTFAYRDIPKNTSKETTKWIKGTTNNAPSSGNIITKVEIGIEAKVENTNVTIYTVPIFGGSTDGDEHILSIGISNETEWVDITNDTNAPGWTWSDIQNLDIKCYGENTSYFNAYMEYINQFYVRVTSSAEIPAKESEELHYYKVTSANPNLFSDNFNDNSLDAGWTEIDNSTSVPDADISETNQRIEMTGTVADSGDVIRLAIMQDSTSGDFDVQVFVVVDSSFSSSSNFHFGRLSCDNEPTYYVSAENYIEFDRTTFYIQSAVNNSYKDKDADWDNSWYFRAKYDSVANILYFYYSSDGSSWTLLNSGNPGQSVRYIKLGYGASADSFEDNYCHFDNFVNNIFDIQTDISIYKSECGLDGTSCMNYSLPVCVDGTNISYCQITTNLSHNDMSDLRIRKNNTTYGVLKTFDKDE